MATSVPRRLKGRATAVATRTAIMVGLGCAILYGQGSRDPDSARYAAESLEHFQALLRLDTSNPPGNEHLVTDYLKSALEKEGIPVRILALEQARPNLVARLKGSGARRPILLMGHSDVVTVDEKKWTFPPFGAIRDRGYIYGRGALDDKPSIAAALMAMLTLTRLGVPLERDVILLVESGEEGTTRVGIDYVVNEYFSEIEAEYCLAEGGGVRRENGAIKYASVGVLEKIPRTIELVARGPSAHGSVPRTSNALTRLAAAVSAISRWEAPIRLNETTREYFTRLAAISSSDEATYLRGLLSSDRRTQAAAIEYFQERNPVYVAMLRTSVSPTIIQGGQRYNIVPSQATATLDVRLVPDEDPDQILATIRQLVNDPAVEVRLAERDGAPRPVGGTHLDTDAFRAIENAVKKHYQTTLLPTMSTGASDKAQVRSKGVHCYGVGPATDVEDGAKGFAAHSDQERILESELQRFTRFYWDVVVELARAK
jgi:acetylornithine deacetylase/succinyl-diaminopimelate desuccinylase-like protein